jgi:hypothetical protein
MLSMAGTRCDSTSAFVKFRGADRGSDTSPEVSLIDDPEAVQSWRPLFHVLYALQGDQTIPATTTDEERLTAYRQLCSR